MPNDTGGNHEVKKQQTGHGMAGKCAGLAVLVFLIAWSAAALHLMCILLQAFCNWHVPKLLGIVLSHVFALGFFASFVLIGVAGLFWNLRKGRSPRPLGWHEPAAQQHGEDAGQPSASDRGACRDTASFDHRGVQPHALPASSQRFVRTPWYAVPLTMAGFLGLAYWMLTLQIHPFLAAGLLIAGGGLLAIVGMLLVPRLYLVGLWVSLGFGIVPSLLLWPLSLTAFARWQQGMRDAAVGMSLIAVVLLGVVLLGAILFCSWVQAIVFGMGKRRDR